MTAAINTAFRDYATDGVPASGAWKPRKADIRNAINGLFDLAATGYGWADDSPTPAEIIRLNDRLFVGADATAYDGNKTSPAGGWLIDESHAPYLMINATIAGVARPSSNTVAYGILGASYVDASWAAGGIGIMGYGRVAGKRAWGGYFEAEKMAGVATNYGTAFGVEIDATNLTSGTYGMAGPHQTSFGAGQTGALLVASGGGDVTAHNAQFGIAFSGNGHPFLSDGVTPDPSYAGGGLFQAGIVFSKTSLVPDAVSNLMHAIRLPELGMLEWIENTTNGPALQIYSYVSDAAHFQAIIVNNGGLRIFNASGKVIFYSQWGNASAVNAPTLIPAITGADVYLSFTGDDTNGSVSLLGKGTGGASLRDGAGARKVQVNTTGIGFFAATPVAKQAITGNLSAVTDANAKAVLTSILLAFTNYGVATNSTT